MPDGELLVLTVANLRPEKGYDVLLDAAHLAGDRGLPLRFAAVGRGPLEQELEERRRALGLGDRFRFLGQRDDVLRLLAGADIFVLPSRQEGLPVTLMEATSVGPAHRRHRGRRRAPGHHRRRRRPRRPARTRPDAVVDALATPVRRPGSPRTARGRGAKAKSAMFDVASASREVEGDLPGPRRRRDRRLPA